MATPDFYKASGLNKKFTIDWRDRIVQAWGRERAYVVDDIVRAPFGTGYYYKCTTAGVSGGAIPDFSSEADAEMADGSVVWTVKHPDSAGLFTISASVWTVDPGLTTGVEAIDGFYTSIYLDDGDDGEQYRATNVITLSNGLEYQDSMVIEIADPVAV